MNEYPSASIHLDKNMAALSLWLVAGLFLDGWAHNTLHDAIETFLTPWHAVLYSGLAATSAVLGHAWLRNIQQGFSWTHALPEGYMLSLLGIGIFGSAGLFDFMWHSIFGFEVDIEALLSPPHLMLAAGGLLVVSGPLRATWQRVSAQDGWAELWPALISTFVILSIFTFFTQFSNAFQYASILADESPIDQIYFWEVTTISYVLIPAGLIMGVILLLMHRWTLPHGTLVVFITGNALMMFLMGSSYSGDQWPVLIAALVGSIIAEVLYARMKPSTGRIRELRLFAFGVPFVLYLLYFGILIMTVGIWWRIHMWFGASLLAGAIGLGLSFLMTLPSR